VVVPDLLGHPYPYVTLLCWWGRDIDPDSPQRRKRTRQCLQSKGNTSDIIKIDRGLIRPGSHSGKAGIHYTAFAPICSLDKLVVFDKCQSQSADFGQLLMF